MGNPAPRTIHKPPYLTDTEWATMLRHGMTNNDWFDLSASAAKATETDPQIEEMATTLSESIPKLGKVSALELLAAIGRWKTCTS